MSERQSGGRVNLARRRRTLRWAIVPAALLVAAGGVLAWVFRLRIERALERPPTLPPPLPTGDSTGQPDLYTADFDDPARLGDWEAPFDDGVASARFADGKLIVSVNALANTGTWLALNYTLTDFTLEVDAAVLEGNADSRAIVLFRMTGPQDYARLDVGADGSYSVSAVQGGTAQEISAYNLSPAIRTGSQANRIRVSARGDSFEFAVNGEPLQLCVSDDPAVRPIWNVATGECLGGEVTTVWRSPALPRGKIGLGVQAYTGFDGQSATPALGTVAFDNLAITQP